LSLQDFLNLDLETFEKKGYDFVEQLDAEENIVFRWERVRVDGKERKGAGWKKSYLKVISSAQFRAREI